MKRKKMKALSLIFEHVLLFMFSVIIFISSLALFRGYESSFNELTVKDQLTEIGEYISSNIIKLSEREEASIKIRIPTRAGNEFYIVYLSNTGLNLTSMDTNITRHFDLYNINKSLELKGRVVSSSGNSMIYKTGNQIIIT